MKSLSEKYNYRCMEIEEKDRLVLERNWFELARVEQSSVVLHKDFTHDVFIANGFLSRCRHLKYLSSHLKISSPFGASHAKDLSPAS